MLRIASSKLNPYANSFRRIRSPFLLRARSMKDTVNPTSLSENTENLRIKEIPSFKVYTKTGDKGTSSLYNGERRRKDDEVFEALGDVDELNSALGVAHEFCKQGGLLDSCKQIEEIQSRLLDVGSAVATPVEKSSSRKVERTRFDPSAVTTLEKWIDAMDEELTPLHNFILPSGGLAATHLHMARTLCRRAERRVVPLVHQGQAEPVVGQYLNRLSDYLFTVARYAALKGGAHETIYKKVPLVEA